MPFTTTTALLVAAGVSAVGAVSAGVAEKDRADFSAADQIQQAAREREISKEEEIDFRRKQSRIFAASRAAGGGSGTDLSTGSNLLTAQDFAAETELQALRIRAGGKTASSRLIDQSKLTKASGFKICPLSIFLSCLVACLIYSKELVHLRRSQRTAIE